MNLQSNIHITKSHIVLALYCVSTKVHFVSTKPELHKAQVVQKYSNDNVAWTFFYYWHNIHLSQFPHLFNQFSKLFSGHKCSDIHCFGSRTLSQMITDNGNDQSMTYSIYFCLDAVVETILSLFVVILLDRMFQDYSCSTVYLPSMRNPHIHYCFYTIII